MREKMSGGVPLLQSTIIPKILTRIKIPKINKNYYKCQKQIQQNWILTQISIDIYSI